VTLYKFNPGYPLEVAQSHFVLCETTSPFRFSEQAAHALGELADEPFVPRAGAQIVKG